MKIEWSALFHRATITSFATADGQLDALYQLRSYEQLQSCKIINILQVFMAALCPGHYIFSLWFLSFFFYLFSSPNLSGRRLAVYHTYTHGVALVRI